MTIASTELAARITIECFRTDFVMARKSPFVVDFEACFLAFPCCPSSISARIITVLHQMNSTHSFTANIGYQTS